MRSQTGCDAWLILYTKTHSKNGAFTYLIVDSIETEAATARADDVLTPTCDGLKICRWVFPKMVVPPKHPKMVISSRKTNSCWVPPF